MINFNCSKCLHEIETPDSNIGLLEKCPNCGETVAVPSTSSSVTDGLKIEESLMVKALGFGEPLQIPKYESLVLVIGILNVFAWITIGLSIPTMFRYGGAGFLGAIVLFVSGLFQFGFAQLLECVRDIAINSFKVKND